MDNNNKIIYYLMNSAAEKAYEKLYFKQVKIEKSRRDDIYQRWVKPIEKWSTKNNPEGMTYINLG